MFKLISWEIELRLFLSTYGESMLKLFFNYVLLFHPLKGKQITCIIFWTKGYFSKSGNPLNLTLKNTTRTIEFQVQWILLPSGSGLKECLKLVSNPAIYKIVVAIFWEVSEIKTCFLWTNQLYITLKIGSNHVLS